MYFNGVGRIGKDDDINGYLIDNTMPNNIIVLRSIWHSYGMVGR